MLRSLKEIFETKTIEINNAKERIPLHSNTSEEQGVFIQKMFELAAPRCSIEVGFAYGISTMFILEKYGHANATDKAHIVIEPDAYWGPAAVHNIEKEGLLKFVDIKRDYSDKILPKLYSEGHQIQFAYIDTTKQFDVVMQDFYFISRMLDAGGIIVLDDCQWPGIQRVARFVNTLPHFEIVGVHDEAKTGIKKKMAEKVLAGLLSLIPFQKRIYRISALKTDRELELNYNCIAFRKTGEDTRKWDWDKIF